MTPSQLQVQSVAAYEGVRRYGACERLSEWLSSRERAAAKLLRMGVQGGLSKRPLTSPVNVPSHGKSFHNCVLSFPR